MKKYHKDYENLKMMIKHNLPVILVGPTGCGKTFSVEQLAKELQFELYTPDYLDGYKGIYGYYDSDNKYCESSLVKALKNGGIFFFDELDTVNPSIISSFALLMDHINSSKKIILPNNEAILPHANFRMIAASNTRSDYIQNEYKERYVVDKALFNRFYFLPFDYDNELEEQLLGNTALVFLFKEVRKFCNLNNLEFDFSTREANKFNQLFEKLHKVEKKNIEEIVQLLIVNKMPLPVLEAFYNICKERRRGDEVSFVETEIFSNNEINEWNENKFSKRLTVMEDIFPTLEECVQNKLIEIMRETYKSEIDQASEEKIKEYFDLKTAIDGSLERRTLFGYRIKDSSRFAFIHIDNIIETIDELVKENSIIASEKDYWIDLFKESNKSTRLKKMSNKEIVLEYILNFEKEKVINRYFEENKPEDKSTAEFKVDIYEKELTKKEINQYKKALIMYYPFSFDPLFQAFKHCVIYSAESLIEQGILNKYGYNDSSDNYEVDNNMKILAKRANKRNR
jgi:hypothetical protein